MNRLGESLENCAAFAGKIIDFFDVKVAGALSDHENIKTVRRVFEVRAFGATSEL